MLLTNKKLNEINRLSPIEKIRKVIKILRDPVYGCPWDLKQNYNTLAPYSLEEAYELVNAIESNDTNEIKGELGDLLLQVVLISQVASDKGDFNFDDVAEEISKKIIRRHPQIFDENYKENDRPHESWERIKNLENNETKIKSKNILDGIEKNIPSILRSIKIQKKVSSLNFDWPNHERVLIKIDEEFNELKSAINSKKEDNIEEELGDVFFTLISLCRHLSKDPDNIVRKANNIIEKSNNNT